MIAAPQIDTRIELLSGSAVVQSDAVSGHGKLNLVMNGHSVLIAHPGLYCIDVAPPELKVFRGTAVVEKDGRSVTMGAGRTSVLASGGIEPARKFDVHKGDAFDVWSLQRVQVLAKASGLTALQDLKRADNEASATRLAELQVESRNPFSGQDVLAPPLRTPTPGPSGVPVDHARLCLAR